MDWGVGSAFLIKAKTTRSEDHQLMNIVDDTTSYETWLGGFTEIDADDLARKHALMADRRDAFPFFRGTFYRWLRHWPSICPELTIAPARPVGRRRACGQLWDMARSGRTVGLGRERF